MFKFLSNIINNAEPNNAQGRYLRVFRNQNSKGRVVAGDFDGYDD